LVNLFNITIIKNYFEQIDVLKNIRPKQAENFGNLAVMAHYQLFYNLHRDLQNFNIKLIIFNILQNSHAMNNTIYAEDLNWVYNKSIVLLRILTAI
jgi:hypothetical protein